MFRIKSMRSSGCVLSIQYAARRVRTSRINLSILTAREFMDLG